MAAIKDLGPFYRGEDLALNFTMTPLTDITGWTMSCRVKPAGADSPILLTISATITSAPAGTFAVAVTAAQTTTLPAGAYSYDVWRTDSGSAAVLALGTLTMAGTVKVP